MLESKFQGDLIRTIKDRWPSAIILKNDPNYIQGMPDLLVLVDNNWAALECKKASNASHRPNQDYYVDVMNKMSFAAFIFPENEEEVLDALQSTFRSSR